MPRQTPNMPIAIDARMLDRDGTGVATYARALETALKGPDGSPLRIADRSCGLPMTRADRASRWIRWADALIDRPRRLRHMDGAFRARDIFRLAQVHFDRHGTMLKLRAPGPAGIVHWTYPLPIRIEGWQNIYTVHDAIPLTHPELSQIEPTRHQRLLMVLAESAAHLLTVSEAARTDVLAALGCPPGFITACAPGLWPEPPGASLPEDLTPGGFLLFVGSVEPRKNLSRLAEAYRLSGVSMPLVIAGPDGWRSGEIAQRLADTPGIIRLPYLDRPALVALIAAARALVFPTITEGFGLPIIEAMHLGTAVLTSRGGATEEVGGDAVLLADPLSITELTDQIRRLAGDDILVDQLSRAGRARAASFSLDAFAARLRDVHQKLSGAFG